MAVYFLVSVVMHTNKFCLPLLQYGYPWFHPISLRLLLFLFRCFNFSALLTSHLNGGTDSCHVISADSGWPATRCRCQKVATVWTSEWKSGMSHSRILLSSQINQYGLIRPKIKYETRCRTPSIGDQPIARPLQFYDTHTRTGFWTLIPVCIKSETVHDWQ